MNEEAVHEPEALDADVDEQVEMNTDRKGQKRPTGANGYRYTKKTKQDANLEKAVNLATNARRHIETAFFSKEETPDKVIEIAFLFLENDKNIKRYLRNPDAFVVSSLRKRKVEISEKNLNPDEKELIRTAKGKEIK